MQLTRKGNWIDLYSDPGQQHPNFIRIVRKAENPVMGALILPLIVSKEGLFIILIANRRIPLGKYVLELPGGYVDRHQTVEQAAARELLEETGFKLKEFLFSSPMLYCDPWKSDETEQVICAIVDEKRQEQSLQDEQDILIRKIRIGKEIEKQVDEICKKEGFLIDSKIVQILHGLNLTLK